MPCLQAAQTQQSPKQSCRGLMHGMLGLISHAVQLQGDATGWADEFGGVSQAAEQWADQFAEQVVPNEEVCKSQTAHYADSNDTRLWLSVPPVIRLQCFPSRHKHAPRILTLQGGCLLSCMHMGRGFIPIWAGASSGNASCRCEDWRSCRLTSTQR